MVYKAGEIARRLNVHENTVRLWSDQYAQYMSAGALARAPGAKRHFTADDLRVLATVANLRTQGLKPAQIEAALTDGKLIETIPEAPTPEEEAARASIALIPLPKYEHALNEIQIKQAELQRVISERDNAQVAKEEANRRIADLQREIGVLEGRLDNVETVLAERRPAVWWLRVVAAAVLVAVAVTIATALLLAVALRGG